MFCPKCHCEYLQGTFRCVDCDVPLVDAITSNKKTENVQVKTIVVYEANNEVDLLFAKSILEEAHIPFICPHAGIQDLFGAGRIGGYNLIVGPIAIMVKETDVDIAREVLSNAGLQSK